MRPLTVVIPTYNEADNLRAVALSLWSLELPDLRILIVDDASPDGTGQLAEALSAEQPGRISVIHREGKLGLGSAYITGFKHALKEGARAVVQMDADFSHSPSYLPDFAEHLEQADAVLGSRYIPGARLDERWGFGRVLLSRWGNFYARTILGLKVRDATGGFRMWRAETLSGMPLDSVRSNGYLFQVEMAYVAQRLGYRMLERPIYFEDRRIGQSKMSMSIQLEAALRIWQVLFIHRHLRPHRRL
ncbi:MAG TPA: polyprenol monophosphomannose synthase [Anaerolineales bacterium]|nr:polyprenol monophosphomannose synthase [Anaerolineales bacterium]